MQSKIGRWSIDPTLRTVPTFVAVVYVLRFGGAELILMMLG